MSVLALTSTKHAGRARSALTARSAATRERVEDAPQVNVRSGVAQSAQVSGDPSGFDGVEMGRSRSNRRRGIKVAVFVGSGSFGRDGGRGGFGGLLLVGGGRRGRLGGFVGGR
jgi:hypothetical protein